MARSSRSSSISSDSSANGEEGSYKRLKLGETNMEFASSSSSNSDKQKQQSSSSSNNQNNSKTQAAFVNKLYKMLEDPHTIELISWSASGDLFSVSNPTAFSKTILPQYFKHNNWQSFVRQLNMYGFHKVNDLIHSNLTNENQTWEFKHPYFRKGQVWNLQHIRRKNAKTQQQILFQQQQRQQAREQIQNQYILHTKLEEVAQAMDEPDEDQQNTPLLNHIVKIEDQLMSVSKTCELLFKEMINLRVIISKQQDAMQDLVDVVSIQSNNTCVCGNTINNNNNNDNTSNQDLQNAESLRLQVSKLKNRSANGGPNNSNRESLSDSSNSSTSSILPSWSPAVAIRNDNSSSVNSTPSPNQGLSFTSPSPATDTKRTQRLPSIDYMRQANKNGSNNNNNNDSNEDSNNKSNNSNGLEMLKPMSSYFNNDNDSNSNDKSSQSTYQSKSSSSPSRDDSNNDNRNKQNEENDDRSSTSFMTLGKRSHILNPVHLEKKEGKRPVKRKNIKSARENEDERKNLKQENHHT